jgi:hypothetical protein
MSTDSKESGLWLWHGEAPLQPSLPRPKSRAQPIFRRIMPAAGWAGRIALPIGLALIAIAVSMTPHPERSVSADKPAVALSPAPSPAAADLIVAVPAAKPTQAQLDQVQVPSEMAAKIRAREPEPNWRLQPKSSRTSRKSYAL